MLHFNNQLQNSNYILVLSAQLSVQTQFFVQILCTKNKMAFVLYPHTVRFNFASSTPAKRPVIFPCSVTHGVERLIRRHLRGPRCVVVVSGEIPGICYLLLWRGFAG